MFAIQDEITAEIIKRLRATFDIALPGRDKHHAGSVEAYDLYLKGRYCFNLLKPDWVEKTISFYDQAIEKDPRFAPAYAAKAEAFIMMASGFDILPSREAMPKAKKAALKALEELERAQELDPLNLLVKVRMGYVHYYLRDFDGAVDMFNQILSFEPNFRIGLKGDMYHLSG